MGQEELEMFAWARTPRRRMLLRQIKWEVEEGMEGVRTSLGVLRNNVRETRMRSSCGQGKVLRKF